MVMTPQEQELEGLVTSVESALDAAYARALALAGEAPLTVDISSDRLIIFSDLHRGARNGADDFQNNERALNAALAYYYGMGHSLLVLGDAEELWEERPAPVLKAYRHSLGLEAEFHRLGRYLRIWGNHDDEWQFPGRVAQLLAPIFWGRELDVREGMLITVTDGGAELGTFFLVHGHQGDAKSDRFSWLSRYFVRYVWRPIQRLTGWSQNTPARRWDLRDRYNKAMYYWAEARHKLVLVAGHTHRPVFKSESHESRIRRELEELARDDGLPDDQMEAQAALLAKLEWVRAQENQEPGPEINVPMAKPCYFSTGCCCFLDGDITGIEIAHGEIRLVRWPDEEYAPNPHILARASLRDVFAAC